MCSALQVVRENRRINNCANNTHKNIKVKKLYGPDSWRVTERVGEKEKISLLTYKGNLIKISKRAVVSYT